MKELILDEKTWKCGGTNNQDKRCATGKGDTYLLNNMGYMCCLGQFSKQINPLITDKDIYEKGGPSSVNILIEGLNKPSEDWYMDSTYLSKTAIGINDDTTTTIKEKVQKLKKLFSENGFKIKFIRKAWLPRLIDKISLKFS